LAQAPSSATTHPSWPAGWPSLILMSAANAENGAVAVPGKERKKVPSIPEDYVIDKDAVYTGTVVTYQKWQGYGFIQPDQAGLVPEDKLWVHWSNIQTEDRFPFLTKDMKVEFGLMRWTRGKGEWQATTLRAKKVTEVGGAPIAVQEAADAEKKEFLESQSKRYTGTLKFYVPKQGYGYVTVDDGNSLDESVPKELRVEAPEVNCAGRRPTGFLESTAVEFGIVKNRKGQFNVYNMTLPNGVPMTKANVEHRETPGDQTFRGTISHYQPWQGWGFIAPENASLLPPHIQQALAKQQAAAKVKSKKDEEPAQVFYFTKADVSKGCNAKKDMKVIFKVYLDDKGAGACDVTAVEE